MSISVRGKLVDTRVFLLALGGGGLHISWRSGWFLLAFLFHRS